MEPHPHLWLVLTLSSPFYGTKSTVRVSRSEHHTRDGIVFYMRCTCTCYNIILQWPLPSAKKAVQ